MLLRHVGVTRSDKTLDQHLHRFDMLGCTRLDAGRQASERLHILMELPLGPFRERADGLVQRAVGIFFGRPRVDLVVHIGDVAHIDDMIGAVNVAEQPKKHIKHDDRPRIADVGKIIDRRPAHIEANARGLDRVEPPLLPRPCIVPLQCHAHRSVSPTHPLSARRPWPSMHDAAERSRVCLSCSRQGSHRPANTLLAMPRRWHGAVRGRLSSHRAVSALRCGLWGHGGVERCGPYSARFVLRPSSSALARKLKSASSSLPTTPTATVSTDASQPGPNAASPLRPPTVSRVTTCGPPPSARSIATRSQARFPQPMVPLPGTNSSQSSASAKVSARLRHRGPTRPPLPLEPAASASSRLHGIISSVNLR